MLGSYFRLFDNKREVYQVEGKMSSLELCCKPRKQQQQRSCNLEAEIVKISIEHQHLFFLLSLLSPTPPPPPPLTNIFVTPSLPLSVSVCLDTPLSFPLYYFLPFFLSVSVPLSLFSFSLPPLSVCLCLCLTPCV